MTRWKYIVLAFVVLWTWTGFCLYYAAPDWCTSAGGFMSVLMFVLGMKAMEVARGRK